MDFPLIYNVFGGERMKKKRRAVILAALGLYLFFLVNPFQLSQWLAAGGGGSRFYQACSD